MILCININGGEGKNMDKIVIATTVVSALTAAAVFNMAAGL